MEDGFGYYGLRFRPGLVMDWEEPWRSLSYSLHLESETGGWQDLTGFWGGCGNLSACLEQGAHWLHSANHWYFSLTGLCPRREDVHGVFISSLVLLIYFVLQVLHFWRPVFLCSLSWDHQMNPSVSDYQLFLSKGDHPVVHIVSKIAMNVAQQKTVNSPKMLREKQTKCCHRFCMDFFVSQVWTL